MRKQYLLFRWSLVGLLTSQVVLAPIANAGNPLARIKRLFQESKYNGTEPCMGQDGAMECLAENIDWLEHHIDEYGSIVAKQPDIWGEARLTKHRDEYERIMFQELGKFEYGINAAISQTDSSFLAQAIALSNAGTGATVTATDPDPDAIKVAVANAKAVSAPDIGNDFTRFGIAKSARADQSRYQAGTNAAT